MKILKVVDVRHDAAAGGIVLEVKEHPVHLIEHALFVLMLHPELIAYALPMEPVSSAQLSQILLPRSRMLLDFFCQIHRSSSTADFQ